MKRAWIRVKLGNVEERIVRKVLDRRRAARLAAAGMTIGVPPQKPANEVEAFGPFGTSDCRLREAARSDP